MKRIFLLLLGAIGYFGLHAQCPEQAPFTSGGVHGTCQDAINVTSYFTSCQTICISNVGAGSSGQIGDAACLGGSLANDLFLRADNPYNAVPGYDGSLAFRWVDWPGKATGSLPPYFAVHAEVEAQLPGTSIVVQGIDCTDGFALENAFCVDPNDGDQFFAAAGTLPTLAQLDPIVDAEAGVNVDVEDIVYWLHIRTSDGLTGDICFEISPYISGNICGDANTLALSGGASSVSGSASGCLCTSAVDGGLGNSTFGLNTACGQESGAAVWYEMELPFDCNEVNVDMSAWGGSDNYQLHIVSGFECPGQNDVNPITGAPIFIPGYIPDNSPTIHASSCGATLNTGCTSLNAGTYYLVVSGETERPTFSLDVTVTDASVSAGLASSSFDGESVCSGADITVSANSTILPNAACGQGIAWYAGTNSLFDPYNGEGDYLGSGLSDIVLSLPANTTCSPITYFIKGIVSDDGTTADASCTSSTNTLNVTVYPEIGTPSILNNQCIIQVAARCSNFTVNGVLGSDTYLATFSEDGLTQDFIISNGLIGCNQTVTETISCSGSCTQPSATSTVTCDPLDPFNFYVEVEFTPGSATSYTLTGTDGSALPLTAAGTYTAGPFSNDTPVTLNIENTEDSACNLPLGTFSDNCNPQTCPNLTFATSASSGEVCTGETVLLEAGVDDGVLNVDFEAQWYLNGDPIIGATTLNHLHTFSTGQGCSSEFQTFSIEIRCLNPDAAPATTTSLSLASGGFNVYPIPEIGTDFFPNPVNCIVAPFDNCGGLNISYSPTSDLNPGDPDVVVNYTVSVTGAPAGCEATGSYVIQCPPASCSSDLGTAVLPPDPVICHNESFDLEMSGTSLDLGYVYGYAVTSTNPYSDLQGAVNSAVANGDFIGPYNAGNTQTFTNGVDYGAGPRYFIPFTSLDIANGTVMHTDGGTFNVASLFGSGSASFTIPQLPYCPGVTSYSMNIVIDQLSNETWLNGIDNISSPFFSGPGGSTDFYEETVTVTGNPSGTTHTINGSGNLAWGSDISWSLTITYNVGSDFPTLCPSCTDITTATFVDLLPEINLTPAISPSVCEGDVFDLNDVNPSSNVPGTITWYDMDPSMGGTPLSSEFVTIVGSSTTYWAEFGAAADPTCSAGISVTIPTSPAPVLTTPPTPDPICAGDVVNLTAMNPGITGGQAGTIIWFKGDPALPGSVQLTQAIATMQTPTDGTTYFAEFTDAGTGCSSMVSVTYSVIPLPVLTPPAINPSICVGGSYDLASLEPSLTGDSGSFTWYEGSPDSGTMLGSTTVSPSSSTQYCTVFTDAVTGCSNSVCVNLNINLEPTLNNVPPQGPLCVGDMFDLSSLNASYTTEAGTFIWYLGDPDAGGTLISDTNITPNATEVYYVEFTSTLTGCSNVGFVTFLISNGPNLNVPTLGSVCEGTTISLVALESLISPGGGTFVWYDGDPDAGGIMLTSTEASSQTPDGSETYYAVVTDATGCTASTSLMYPVNPTPVLTTPPTQAICNGASFDLSTLNNDITTASGSFSWFDGSTPLPSTVVAPANGQAYNVTFMDASGCSASTFVLFTVYEPVSGITASYDCTAAQLVIDYSGATGGSGTGYQVAATSPNTDGQTLANGSNWTVIVEDGDGCQQATILTGTVSCLVCETGTASTSDPTTVCCDETINVELAGETLAPNTIVGYAITADNPVTSQADLGTAIQLIQSDPMDNSLSYTASCALAPGDYYITPFIAEEPDEFDDEITWDPDQGCAPVALICPTITGSDWIMDPMIITFPDGSTYNVNDEQAFGLAIDSTLLAGIGGLPCINLTDLYNGDPNGTWSISVNNTGTGPMTFNVPDFQITVESDTCNLLSEDQIIDVDGFGGTIEGGTTDNISFDMPPPAPLVMLEYDTLNGCVPNGEFCPEITGSGWVLDPMVFTFPDGSTFNVNDELAFGLPLDSALLAGVGGIPCIQLTDLYTGDPNGTWSLSVNNTGTGQLDFFIPAFDVVVDGATCAALGGVDQVVTIGPLSGSVPGGSTEVLDFDIYGPPPTGFPSILASCEDYGDPIMFTILDPSDPLCTPVSINEAVLDGATLNAYPNPTSGVFTLELTLAQKADINIRLTDLLGRQIRQVYQGNQVDAFNQNIDLNEMPSGVYFIQIQIDGHTLTEKIVKR